MNMPDLPEFLDRQQNAQPEAPPTIEEALALLKRLEAEISEERDGIAASMLRLENLEGRHIAAKRLFKQLARKV